MYLNPPSALDDDHPSQSNVGSGSAASEYLRDNVEPILCTLFQGVLAYKPPDPIPMMIDMLNKQIREEREKAHYQANKEEIDSLRL